MFVTVVRGQDDVVAGLAYYYPLGNPLDSSNAGSATMDVLGEEFGKDEEFMPSGLLLDLYEICKHSFFNHESAEMDTPVKHVALK